jgi:hypothetical protein
VLIVSESMRRQCGSSNACSRSNKREVYPSGRHPTTKCSY